MTERTAHRIREQLTAVFHSFGAARLVASLDLGVSFANFLFQLRYFAILQPTGLFIVVGSQRLVQLNTQAE